MKTSKVPGNPFTVILLGIIYDTKKKRILIGKREKADHYLPKLTWAFPGGRAEPGEELEATLKSKIKEETGVNTANLGMIFAKVYPEKEDLLAIYYLCELINGKEKPAGDLKELKWAKPEELEEFFTTSFHSHLKEYILNLK